MAQAMVFDPSLTLYPDLLAWSWELPWEMSNPRQVAPFLEALYTFSKFHLSPVSCGRMWAHFGTMAFVMTALPPDTIWIPSLLFAPIAFWGGLCPSPSLPTVLTEECFPGNPFASYKLRKQGPPSMNASSLSNVSAANLMIVQGKEWSPCFLKHPCHFITIDCSQQVWLYWR